MTDKPIIFSGPMVRALIDGRKTQTRRLSGLSDVNEHPEKWTLNNVGPLGYMAKASAKGKFGATFESREIEPGTLFVCPQRLPYAPGDRLWVKEAHSFQERAEGECLYRATVRDDTGYNREEIAQIRWRPSIHMPRWASRLTLTVTDVRVQRLQEITPADAIAEGCWVHANSATIDCDTPNPRDEFRSLWNSIHGPDAWFANPWVCALTFTVEHRNIDQ